MPPPPLPAEPRRPPPPGPSARRTPSATPPARWLSATVLVLNALVLAVAVAPFALWEALGPDRFEGLELGVSPFPTVSVMPESDGPTLPDASAPASPEPLPDPWADQRGPIAPDIPLDLGPDVTVTLVFSTGSRGVSADTADRLRVDDLDQRGADGLTDTILVLVSDTSSREAALVSIPRDLWMFDRGHRINASFNRDGPQALVDDVSRITGLPVHHLVQLNFEAFADLVDAMGGVPIPVDRPLADLSSVLYVPAAGCWHLDGTSSLAYVRSRATLTRTSAGWDDDATASDFGRMTRQRQVLGAIWDRIRGPGVVTQVPALLGAARSGLVVDEALGVQQLRDLASAFADLSAGRVEGYTLPSRNERIGRAAALVLELDAARPVLQRLRSWPPAAEEPPAAGAIPVGVGPDGATDPGCTLEAAAPLPDPRAPLGTIADGGDPATEHLTPSSESPTPSEDSPSPSEDGPSSPTPTPESSTPGG